MGRRGLDRGPGGAAPIPFRMVRGSSASPDSPRRPLFLKHEFPYVWSWQRQLFASEHTLRLHGTHALSSLRALLCKPTHGLCGAALPADCVGGTEPQALSGSIAHVKSRVGCDEPPTVPGTIVRRETSERQL